MHPCQRFLEDQVCRTKFGWLGKGVLGCLLYEDKLIVINIWLLVADVYIHEWIHWKHPNWGEDKVRASELRMLGRLTEKQLIGLGKRLIEKFNVGGDR